MNKQSMVFRGQEAIVFTGNEMPVHKEGHFYYGIRRHSTEEIPLTVEKLVILNRWGTIETQSPILFDGRNVDQVEYDRTDLSLEEVMNFMNYN